MAQESIAEALREKRAELMRAEVEEVALRLFDERGFPDVTVEEIAAASGISVRTFYRYFPAKELILQVRIDRRSAALRDALALRPAGEPLLTSLRVALSEAMAVEDPEVVRRWIAVIAAAPDLTRGVLGGVHLKIQTEIANFVVERIEPDDDVFAATILAGAVGGAVQAAMRLWFVNGGDLPATISKSLEVFEQLIGNDS